MLHSLFKNSGDCRFLKRPLLKRPFNLRQVGESADGALYTQIFLYRHMPTMMERRVQAEYLDHIRSFAWLELFFCRRLNLECSLAVFPFMFGSAGPAGFGTTGCGRGASANFDTIYFLFECGHVPKFSLPV